MRERAEQIAAWWMGESASSVSMSRLRRSVMIRTAVTLVAFAFACSVTMRTVRPLFAKKAPKPIPADTDGSRFGVADSVRHAVFDEIAAAEPSAIANGKSSFPGMPWSAEDHRGAFERQTVAAQMRKHHLSMTQVYLILDEGIRNHWPGLNGQPLNPHTVPLEPRRKY